MRTPVLACAVLLAASPAVAEPVWTSAPSVMRRAPSPAARVIQEIPPSAQIYLKSCRQDWCYASWRNRSGYIPAYAVSDAAPPNFGAPPADVEGGAIVIGPPPVQGPGFSLGRALCGRGLGRAALVRPPP